MPGVSSFFKGLGNLTGLRKPGSSKNKDNGTPKKKGKGKGKGSPATRKRPPSPRPRPSPNEKKKRKKRHRSSRKHSRALSVEMKVDTDLTIDDLRKDWPPFKKAQDQKLTKPEIKERRDLLIRKLQLCSIIIDFNDDDPELDELKERKKRLLYELVDHIGSDQHWFSENTLKHLLLFFAANLFRVPPNRDSWAARRKIAFMSEEDEEEPFHDPAWEHLQLVYEILVRFVLSADTDLDLIKKHIKGRFMLKIVNLLESEDVRERDYLKTILHRIYGRFMGLRAGVRKAINNIFYDYIYRGRTHNGVGELLDILGSIIHGFSLPIKEEHRRFLRNILIPLHKVPELSCFHTQLSECVSQFVFKDWRLSNVVLGGLLKFWPRTSSTKLVLYMTECEDIFEMLDQAPDFDYKFSAPILTELFKCFSLAAESDHFQVAERALYLWHSQFVCTITQQFKDTYIPLCLPSIMKCAQAPGHWNEQVRQLSTEILAFFKLVDTKQFDHYAEQFEKLTLEAPVGAPPPSKPIAPPKAKKKQDKKKNGTTSTTNEEAVRPRAQSSFDRFKQDAFQDEVKRNTATRQQTMTRQDLWEHFRKMAASRGSETSG